MTIGGTCSKAGELVSKTDWAGSIPVASAYKELMSV